MTGPHPDAGDAETRPISVAELLARNGNIGSPPVTGRRRRRRGNSDAVTVAELTGEIPVIRDDDSEPDRDGPAPHAHRAFGSGRVAEPAAEPAAAQRATVGWSEAGPRWPESPPQPRRSAGPERSHYPQPLGLADQPDRGPASQSDAEQMSPDPVDTYAGIDVGVMDTDVRDADLPTEDAAYPRSYLRTPRRIFSRLRASTDEPEPAGPAVDEHDPADLDEGLHDDADAAGEPDEQRSVASELLSGGAIVLQSILAVVFGAGLFIAFDQLWRWNNIVALVLTVLVTLGLVAAVQAVRQTVDIGSTLTAVAVGLLVTLGPLALHAN